MVTDKQNNSIGHLKTILLEQIEGQEVNEKLYRRILRRLSFISVFLSMTVLGGIFFIIFTLNRPHSVLTETLEAKRDLDAINSIQFRIMKSNTETIQKKANKEDLDTRMRLHSDFINMNTATIKKLTDTMKRRTIEIESLRKQLEDEKLKNK